MLADDVRFLFAYDRWGTRRILAALDGLSPRVWSRPETVGDRSMGEILVHQLGAAQRWRIGFESRGEREGPHPEDEPAPSIAELRERWDAEWVAVDAWLATLSDEFVAVSFDSVPVWQLLVHVVNHGTQHRSEVAALLTSEGHSPGDLDLVDYAEEQAAGKAAS